MPGSTASQCWASLREGAAPQSRKRPRVRRRAHRASTQGAPIRRRQLRREGGAEMSAFFNIDPPSATSFIEAFGINASDQIVGFYDNTQRHGFLYSGGTYATLDDPLGTVETVAQGVNNADQVVGYYIGSNGVFHGFFVDAAFGLYAPIDDPLAGTTSSGNGEGTYAQGINNAHQIVGYYVDSSHRYHGFLYANGSYFPLDFPSATATRALGINDAGQIVGAYDNASGHHGFLYANGVYTSIDDPLAGPMPGQGTYAAAGINNTGHIVGYYVDGSSKFHGFLETPNPPPPAGTTADMILRHGADGKYEIYDIGNNAMLAAYQLGQVGTEWQFVGLGGFFGSDTTDMLLRNSNTGGFEVYDIANNIITNAAFLGAIGLEWQLMGFGNFSSLGETDMRNV